jgi:retinol dehydrogenase 12
MACRSEEKANGVIEELAKETGKTAVFLKLDLSNLGSVERAAEDFLLFVFC